MASQTEPRYDGEYIKGSLWLDDLARCDGYDPCGDCCRCLARPTCGTCEACLDSGEVAEVLEVDAEDGD